MKTILFFISISLSMLSYSQYKIKRFEMGIGVTSFIPNHITYTGDFRQVNNRPANYIGANINLGVTFLKHFSFTANYTIGTTTYADYAFSQNGKRIDYYPNGENVYYFSDYAQVITNQRYHIRYNFNPFSRLNFSLGIGGGINGLYTFNEVPPLFDKLNLPYYGEDEEDINNHIEKELPEQLNKVKFISPVLNVCLDLTSALSLNLAVEYRYYFKQQYIYVLTDLIYEEDYDFEDESYSYELTKLNYLKYPIHNMNYTIGLNFKFGNK